MLRNRILYRDRAGLITGASSGLGESLAYELAGRGMRLLLTALPADADQLSAVAAEVGRRSGCVPELVLMDLAVPGAGKELQRIADERGFEPDLLVNNAGMGLLGPFIELPLDRQLAMVRLNVEAVFTLTGIYLPRMVNRHDGAILNIASTAAFDPMPYLAVYAATKAFVLRLSEALWAEAHRAGVRVVACCPGPMADTQFGTRGGPHGVGEQRLEVGLRKDDIVARALRALEEDQPTAVHRVPLLAQAYGVARLVTCALPKRVRLRSAERLVRWYFRL